MEGSFFFVLTWQKKMTSNYRRCTARDLETLANLSRETFITAFGAVNDPVDLKTYCNKAFHPTALKKELGNPDSHFYFALQPDFALVKIPKDSK